MPIAQVPPEASFVGDGTSRVFPLGFYAEFKSQLRVYVNQVEQTTGWAFADGAVTFATAPDTTAQIRIVRQTLPQQVTEFVRATSYASAGVVVPQYLDTDLDRLWMVAQDQARTNTTFADALASHEQMFGAVETSVLNATAAASTATTKAASAAAAAAAAAADQTASTAAAAAAASSATAAAASATTASGHAANASGHAANASASATAAAGSAAAVADNAATVAAAKTAIDGYMPAVQSASGGNRPFATLDDLNAYSGGDKSTFVANVMSDGTMANNGLYRWTGSAWVKSGYDPATLATTAKTEAIAAAATDATTKANAAQAAAIATAAADASTKTNAVSTRVVKIELETAEYTGSADVAPLVTDSENRMLLGVNKITGNVFVAGAVTESIVPEMLGRNDMVQHTGSGTVVPFVVDAANRVVFGFDRTAGKLVGAGLDGGAQAATAAQPLPTAIAPKAVNHLLFYGQSLSVGANAGGVLSTTQPYSNITFRGGPRAWDGSNWDFGPFKPLVEDAVSPAPDGSSNRSETVCSGAANYASTTMALRGTLPSSHVILASTAGHGGYRIANLKKSAPWYSTLTDHVSNAHLLNADHAVHAVGWVQGENDVTAPTSYSTYRADLNQLQIDMETDIKAITGQTHPVYLLSYQCSWSITTNSAIALAQLDLCQKNPKFALVTPTYHLTYAGDNIHLTAVGYKRLGAYFGRAYAAIVRGERPQWLNPVSATVRGSEIRVRFDVPQLPLVLDTTTLAITTNHGFAVLDGGSSATISSIKTDGRDVIITLSATPAGAVTVRYALDYLGAGLSIGNGASGNLRDSTTDTINIGGAIKPLYHVCPAFELAAIKLGE